MGQTSSSSQVDYTFGFIANDKPDPTNTALYNQQQRNSNSNDNYQCNGRIKDERILLYPGHYGLQLDSNIDSIDDDIVKVPNSPFSSSSSFSACSLSLNQHRSSFSSTMNHQKQHIDRIDSGYADQEVFSSKKQVLTLNHRLAQDLLYIDQSHYADTVCANKEGLDTTPVALSALSSSFSSSFSTAGGNNYLEQGREQDDEMTIRTKLTFAAAALASQDSSMREICLSRRSLISLGPKIGLLTSIRKLDLSNNLLRELPDSIGQLKQLEVLSITNNQLRSLPDSIQCLSRLTELDLSHNQLQQITSLGHFSSLCTLLLSHNQLSSIPSDLAGMKRLVTMDLSYNPLSVLPAEITRLSHLRRLRLDHCHQLLNHEEHRPLEYTLKHDPPSLIEICARKIIGSLASNNGHSQQSRQFQKKSIAPSSLSLTQHKLSQLTSHLLSYLASAKICSSCHGPYFESYVVRRRLLEKNDLWIPLEYRLCSAHWTDENDRLLNMFHNETPTLHSHSHSHHHHHDSSGNSNFSTNSSNDMNMILGTLYTLAGNQQQIDQQQQQTSPSSSLLCMDNDEVKLSGKTAFLRHPQRLQRVRNKNPSTFFLHKMQRG